MRALGLDYGARTVGVAVTDALGLTAQCVETITRKEETHLRSTLRRIGELSEQYSTTEIVLGYPLNMDGTVGERARKTLAFKEALERRLRLPVHLVDERLTTVEAEEILAEQGIKSRDYKKYVDQIAAAIILTEWLRNIWKP